MADAQRRKLDLRKQPQPPPPPRAASGPPPAPLEPGMFEPGQVIDPKFMTAWEREQLATLGWEEGTPVPGNAADLIAAAQREATVGGPLPIPADTPPVTMPPPVDINRLPLAKQRELRAALEQAGRLQEQLLEQEAATTGLPPGVGEAMRVAREVSDRNPGVAVIDDRPSRQPAPAARAPTVIPPGPKPQGWYRPPPPPPEPPPEPEPEPLPEPEPPPEPEPDATSPQIGQLSDTGAAGLTHCPHCSWDLKRTDPIVPDVGDKRAYLIATLAGPGHRFVREATLMGGTVKVGYRELTGKEADAALRQIADDYRKGKIVGDGEWWQRLMDYRMIQGIAYVEIEGVGRVHEGVDLDEIESDDGNPTPYPAMVDHMLTTILHAEGMRRAIGQGYMRFQRLCEKLEANADEPSFWEGIGSLALMVQAAAAGVVDFGKADPQDPKWWRGLRLIGDRLEQENLKEYYRLYNDRVVAILARDTIGHESAEKLLNESDTQINRVTKILFPWIDLDPEKARKQEAQKLRSGWESWFGKLDDPETQRRIQETADWLRGGGRKKVPRKGRR